MILLSHVVIALLSVAYTAYVFFVPSVSKLKVSYGLTALTIASGTYLVIQAPAHMTEACMAGLFYIVMMITMIVMVRSKLANTAGEQI